MLASPPPSAAVVAPSPGAASAGGEISGAAAVGDEGERRPGEREPEGKKSGGSGGRPSSAPRTRRRSGGAPAPHGGGGAAAAARRRHPRPPRRRRRADGGRRAGDGADSGGGGNAVGFLVEEPTRRPSLTKKEAPSGFFSSLFCRDRQCGGPADAITDFFTRAVEGTVTSTVVMIDDMNKRADERQWRQKTRRGDTPAPAPLVHEPVKVYCRLRPAAEAVAAAERASPTTAAPCRSRRRWEGWRR